MRKYLAILAVFAVLLLLIPLVSLPGKQASANDPENDDKPVTVITTVSPEPTMPLENVDAFRVLDTSTNEVLTVSLRDYLVGAVAAEMPASFHEEALKAQAVVAHTYAVRQAQKARATPDPSLSGADFSNDPAKFQAYFTDEQMKAFYGDKYLEYKGKIEMATRQVEQLVLTYEGEAISAAFHSISSGITESAQTIWGKELPYLQPVLSSYDLESPDYTSSKQLSAGEVRTALLTLKPEIVLPEDPSAWFAVTDRSYSGTIKSLTAGDATLTGVEARALFELRSSCFEISFADGMFTFATKGYGHGVGMSQYGANAMALAGKSYEEILNHYYTGVVVETLK